MEFEVDKYIKKSESKNPKIRQSVASDPNTPKHLLKRLMKDEDGEVRRSILDNSSATFEMISALTRDDDEYVSDYAKTEFSNRLKKKYPKELHGLIEDATSDDEDIRLNAASDPDLPIELVEHLTNDNDWYVSDSALKNLKNRKDK